MKLQLSHMRALLDSHAVFLKDPPVPLSHAVTQLAAQEPGLVCEGPKDAKDGQPTATYDIIETINKPGRALRLTIQGEKGVGSLAYSKDGKRLARGEGNHVVVCCAESGLEQCQLNVDGQVSSVDWSPCGKKMAAAYNVFRGFGQYDGSVKIFTQDGSAGTFVCQSTLRAHSDWVRAVAWSPCGQWLASGGNDKIVFVYDAETFEVKWPLRD